MAARSYRLMLTTVPGVTAAGIAAMAVLMANTEGMLQSGFETALSAQAANGIAASVHRDSLAGLSGSEEFWLDRAGAKSAVALTKAVAVGDRITITSGGLDKSLDVVGIKDVSSQVTHIDTGGSRSHLLLVTCRDTDAAVTAAGDAQPVHVYIETQDKPLPLPTQSGPRVL